MTSANQSTIEVYPGTRDTRFFVEPFSDPSKAALWISDRIDLQPVFQDGRLFFGLTMETAFHEENGLAGAMSGRLEKIGPYLENSARKLIKPVRLRHGPDQTELPHLQTTAQGVHVFEMTNLPSTTANMVLDIEFQGLDPAWIVSFPISGSPFGHSIVQLYGSFAPLRQQ
jgi:hypothetical protein